MWTRFSELIDLIAVNRLSIIFAALGVPTLTLISYLWVAGIPFVFADPLSITIFFLGMYFNGVIAFLLARLLLGTIKACTAALLLFYVSGRVRRSKGFSRIHSRIGEARNEGRLCGKGSVGGYWLELARWRRAMFRRIDRHPLMGADLHQQGIFVSLAGLSIFAIIFAGPLALYVPILLFVVVIFFGYASMMREDFSLITIPLSDIGLMDADAANSISPAEDYRGSPRSASQKASARKTRDFLNSMYLLMKYGYSASGRIIKEHHLFGVLLTMLAVLLGIAKYHSDSSKFYLIEIGSELHCMAPLLQLGDRTAFFDGANDHVLLIPISQSRIRITECNSRS